MQRCKCNKNSEEYMNASEITGISRGNLVKIFIEKNEYFYKYKHIFDIYYSSENYKKYICDVRVKKDYSLLIGFWWHGKCCIEPVVFFKTV